jgi:flagellar basal body-associated protein FliL
LAARESFERLEHAGAVPHHLDPFARTAAIFIAVLAGLLAVATLLSNEAVKESINNQTKSALLQTLVDANEIKVFVGRSDVRELALVARGEGRDAAEAMRHAARVEQQVAQTYGPRDRALTRRASAAEAERQDYDERHVRYELATVALEIAIVFGSVAIITRMRWLLTGGMVGGAIGVALIVAGLLV